MSGAGEPGAPGPQGADDERDLQTAEYVIGALPPNQARALEVLAMADAPIGASIAASIAAWETRLAPLSDLLPPLEPPPALWRRLALAAGIETIATDPPTPRRGPASRNPPPRPSIWRNAGLWRTTTALATATAAALAALLFAMPPPPPPPPPLVAALSPLTAPGATFLVRVGADGQATITAIGDPDMPQGKSLELWSVAATAPGAPTAAPVSQGLLPGNGRVRLTIKLPAGTQLLVSQEPAGGSPTKAPTGPVLYGGKLTGT